MAKDCQWNFPINGSYEEFYPETIPSQVKGLESYIKDIEMIPSQVKGLESYIKDIVLNGGIPYGKELTESWADLKGRCQTGDFSGIHIGDYKTITLTTGEIVVCEVAGIDQYYRCGDAEIGHHIDFISRDCLLNNPVGKFKFNDANNNNGTAAEKNPWRASKLFNTLNNEVNGVFSTLPSDLKAAIIEKRALLEERYSAGGSVSADTKWSWQDMGKLWLPTEAEVFGACHWSEPGFGSGGSGCNLQYPIFYGGAKHIIKGNGNGGSRCGWWEASADRTNAVSFCYVTGYGVAHYYYASNEGVSVPLCFRVG